MSLPLELLLLRLRRKLESEGMGINGNSFILAGLFGMKTSLQELPFGFFLNDRDAWSINHVKFLKCDYVHK